MYQQPSHDSSKMSDFRSKILVHIKAGDKVNEIATCFDVLRNTVTNIRKKYETTGMVNNLPRSGRTRSVRTEDKVEEIAASIEEQPSTPIRKLSREHQMSVMSTLRVVKEDLNMKSLA